MTAVDIRVTTVTYKFSVQHHPVLFASVYTNNHIKCYNVGLLENAANVKSKRQKDAPRR